MRNQFLSPPTSNMIGVERGAANLEELYKLVKTNEDLGDESEDEDDSESIERANQLYNSML